MIIDPEAPPRWRKLVLVWAIITIGLAGASVAGWRFYKKSWPDRMAERARGFFEAGDMTNASLTIRRALQINPNSVAAARVAAQMTEKLNDPESMWWWRKLVDMQPDSVGDIVALAANAIRFNNPVIAEQALSRVNDPTKQDVQFFSTAGAAAAALGKYDLATKHYTEAVRLEPASDFHHFNLANAQLRSADPETRKAAEASLERLCQSETVRVPALRVTVGILVARHETEAALARSQELQALPGASFDDRLNCLDLLRNANSPEWTSFLTQLQKSAANDADMVGRMVAWMGEHGMAAQAIEWGKTLTPEVLASGRAGAGLAVCYVAGQDWAGLESLVKDANWGEMEYLRFMFFARVLRQQGDEVRFLAQWNNAVSEAAKHSRASNHLARIVATWGWKDELPRLLWQIAGTSNDAEWALHYLFAHYTATGNTFGLARVTGRWLELKPDDDAAKNNFAVYSLLLKQNTERARTIAHELYTKEPSNSVYASSYAYALHLQGRSEEALKIFNSLEPRQLEEPSLAAYYGILLAATGDRERAMKFLDLAKSARLLPEEKELLIQARSGSDEEKP